MFPVGKLFSAWADALLYFCTLTSETIAEKKHMKRVILFIIGVFSLMACTSVKDGKQQEAEVKVLRVAASDNSLERKYTFISQPFRTSELSFRVGGPVSVFDVQSGQFFRKGELIAAIDERDFLISKQRAEAIFRQAEADYRRISNLYEKGNVSGVNYEKARADYEKAKADFHTAQNNLNDTKLYAPFDGYVQQVNIERYQDVSPSYPVVTFIDLSKIKVEAFLPEDMAVSYCTNKEFDCSVEFDALPDTVFSPIDTYLTQSTTENRISYLYTAILDNKDNGLLGGMAGSLKILCLIPSSALREGVAVPQQAVCHTEVTGDFVWRLDEEDRVHKIPVTLGKLEKGDWVEVLSGLSVGDRIAVSRLSYLSENEKITIQN